MAAKLSGSGGGRYDLGQNNEINVTPFVDVMLVLLIIFMVAAPLATVSVEVKLPPATVKAQKYPPKPIFISIKQDGRVYVGDYISSIENLNADIRKSLKQRDPNNERIFIRGDADVMYQEFMRVLTELQKNEFYSVALVGEDKSAAAGGS